MSGNAANGLGGEDFDSLDGSEIETVVASSFVVEALLGVRLCERGCKPLDLNNT